MAWTTPDISQVTLALYNLLTDALTASVGPPLNIPHFNCTINCASPETARTGSDCQLTLYLVHVGRDPYWRNTPRQGPRPLLNDAQPLSLNLYYLLTAWADKNYTHEQQAMTIALQCFHGVPIFRPPGTSDELTLSIEADSIEEMSRLWQAFATPIRLSCLIKVGVAFLTPAKPPPTPQPAPTDVNLAIAPQAGGGPLLFAPTGLAIAPPDPAAPTTVTFAEGPPVIVGGASLIVLGAGLDQGEAAEIYLSAPGGAEWKVTPAWRSAPASAGEIDLVLPAAYAAPATGLPPPPAALPAPGLYLLAVGRDAPAPKVRSNQVALAVAARIDALAAPAVPGGVYTLTGAGFGPAPGGTRVMLDGVDLAAVAASPPGAGQFFVDPAGLSIQFAPAAAGVHALAVLVNGVVSPGRWST